MKVKILMHKNLEFLTKNWVFLDELILHQMCQHEVLSLTMRSLFLSIFCDFVYFLVYSMVSSIFLKYIFPKNHSHQWWKKTHVFCKKFSTEDIHQNIHFFIFQNIKNVLGKTLLEFRIIEGILKTSFFVLHS